VVLNATSRRGIVLSALVVASAPAVLVGQEFQVDLGAENTVRFISRAAIEDFEGVTDRIDGYVLLSTPRLEVGLGGEGSELYMEVDLASLDTGIKLRNRHMRDNYLEVRKYPYATLDGRMGSVQVDPGGGFGVAIVGVLGIHGVSKKVSVLCGVKEEGAGYRATCAWVVLLSDYDIDIPKIMFMKLSEEIRIVLDFALVPASAAVPQTGTENRSRGKIQ